VKQVTITGFEPTFDVDRFKAMHRNLSDRVIRAEMSIDDAVEAACSLSYDPASLYNILQQHLAARNEDRTVLAFRAGAYVVGGVAGLVAPYLLTDDPHGLVVCGSAVFGALALGFPTLVLTYASHDGNTNVVEYDLAYDHISAVVAALKKRHDIHKPLAEELVPGEGDGYNVFHSRRIEPGTGFVERTIRYSLSDSHQALDLFVVNGIPERIGASTKNPRGSSEGQRYDAKTSVHFSYRGANPISFPEAAVQKYQEGIQQYGRLLMR
jgi:hypothetical protein